MRNKLIRKMQVYSLEHKTLAHSGGHVLYLSEFHLKVAGINISKWDLTEISAWKREGCGGERKRTIGERKICSFNSLP